MDIRGSYRRNLSACSCTHVLSRFYRLQMNRPSEAISKKFARSPSKKMVLNGYVGEDNSRNKVYTKLDSCLVITPPNGKKPSAIVKFLGGAFVGAVPEVTYG